MKIRIGLTHRSAGLGAATGLSINNKRFSAPLARALSAAIVVLCSFFAPAEVVVTTLHTFGIYAIGATPNSLVRGSDGNLYGTTLAGGMNSGGTFFKLTPSGELTTLHSFSGGDDGVRPQGGLTLASDGNFYGSAQTAGTNAVGIIFKITPSGVVSRFYTFNGTNDGGSAGYGLIEGSDGNLYGITIGGGASKKGTIFKITTGTTGGIYTTLYSFTGGSDGRNPIGRLMQGRDGNFYGTTVGGGDTNDWGTIFKFSPGGVLTSLHWFTGGSGGMYPHTGIVQGNDGNFYGTTHNLGYGSVFKITPNGDFTILYSFLGGNDGEAPEYELVQGVDGNLYGTASDAPGYNYGTVFKITTNGVFTHLYSLQAGQDGSDPNSRLVQGDDGNFYGATEYSGTGSVGTIFKITPNGVFTSLCSFQAPSDGRNPRIGLLKASDGNFYGATGSPSWLLFKITPDGAFTSLYQFTGGSPNPGLVQGDDGYIYGTTETAGSGYYGSVFKVSTNGVFTNIYSFVSPNYFPKAGVIQGSDGSFYGTTHDNYGGVYKITSAGAYTNLYNFDAVPGGIAQPYCRLVQGADGGFYGTTLYGGSSNVGMVFKITADGAFTNLHSFTGSDGDGPYAGLTQGVDGYLYGSASGGGSSRGGTFFKISTNGEFASIHSVTAGDGISNPFYDLVQGANGNLYGVDPYGGVYGKGDIYRITTNGVFKTLYSFAGGNNNGANPRGALVLGNDGAFYGTTENGGAYGTVFRATIVPAFQSTTLSNNTLALTWSTEPGSIYQLQYKSDLTSGNWINLGNSVTATGETLSATDSVTNDPQRLYRVVVLPQ